MRAAAVLPPLLLTACGDKDTDTDTDADSDLECAGDEGCLSGTGGFGGASGAVFCDSERGELSALVSDGSVYIQCTVDGLVHVSFVLGWAPGSDPAPGTYTFAPGQEAADSGALLMQVTLWDPDETASTTQLFNKDTVTLDIAEIDGAAGAADFSVVGAWRDAPTVDLTDPSWQWACTAWTPDGCAPGDAGCTCSDYFAPLNEGSLDVRFLRSPLWRSGAALAEGAGGLDGVREAGL